MGRYKTTLALLGAIHGLTVAAFSTNAQATVWMNEVLIPKGLVNVLIKQGWATGGLANFTYPFQYLTQNYVALIQCPPPSVALQTPNTQYPRGRILFPLTCPVKIQNHPEMNGQIDALGGGAPEILTQNQNDYLAVRLRIDNLTVTGFNGLFPPGFLSVMAWGIQTDTNNMLDSRPPFIVSNGVLKNNNFESGNPLRIRITSGGTATDAAVSSTEDLKLTVPSQNTVSPY